MQQESNLEAKLKTLPTRMWKTTISISQDENAQDSPELDSVIDVLSPTKVKPDSLSWELPGYTNDWLLLGEGRSKVKLAHHIITKQPVNMHLTRLPLNAYGKARLSRKICCASWS